MSRRLVESLGTEHTRMALGPYHPALNWPIRIDLRLDGESIVSAVPETGFLHRGLEKSFERQRWQAAVAYADHLDPEGAVFGELALCLAVEEICGLKVPERAQSIRVILSELTRISSHLGFAVRMARAVNADTIVHYLLRDRERILDLFELLTGARFSLNFLRFGGVFADVTEGFVERVIEVCDLIRLRLKEYNDLFSYNQGFLERAQGVGEVSESLATSSGLTGPTARASGVSADARRLHPYCGYEKYDFEVPVSTVGDAHSRFIVRLREILQSIELLKQVAEALPPGEYGVGKIGRDFRVPSGEAYARIESSRGILGCHVVSDGGEFPTRVQYRVPSAAALEILPTLLRAARIDDLPVILASLDISIPEVDR